MGVDPLLDTKEAPMFFARVSRQSVTFYCQMCKEKIARGELHYALHDGKGGVKVRCIQCQDVLARTLDRQGAKGLVW